jgi:hypothetical protein
VRRLCLRFDADIDCHQRSGEAAQVNRTIVNWDVAAADWKALKTRAHDDWVKISSK